MQIAKSHNGADLIVSDKIVEKLSASEVLALSERLRNFVLDHVGEFDEKPTKRIEFRGTRFHVGVTENFKFWEQMEKGDWEPATFDVFDAVINENTVFLDIGGWIGSTALYGSTLAKKVYVFEPDPKAFSELKSNLLLNRDDGKCTNVEAFQTAIAPKKGNVRLGFRHRRGDSMSSVLLEGEKSTEVNSIRLGTFLSEKKLTQSPLFVKMDVEGYEYEIIPSLRGIVDELKDATFLISLHPQFLLEKLRMDSSRGKMNESRVRRLFFNKHQALFKTFKNYRCSYVNGTPFKLKREMAKSLITGQFPREILFSRS